MLKVIHRVISNDKQEEYIEFMKNFDYELLERFIEEKTTDLHLINFKNKPYTKQLAKLEKEYFSYEKLSIFPPIFFSAIAFLAITAFLILALVLKPNFDYTFWFLVLLLPAIALILLSVGLFIYSYFKVLKDPMKNKKRQQEIIEECKRLRS